VATRRAVATPAKQPKWTRKNYEDTAKKLVGELRESKLTPLDVGVLVANYCKMYAADNPRFNQDKFIKACTRI